MVTGTFRTVLSDPASHRIGTARWFTDLQAVASGHIHAPISEGPLPNVKRTRGTHKRYALPVALFVYVDNSNVWIEGMRVSAVREGMATDLHDALNRHVTDQTWTYDFGHLYHAICPDTAQIGRSSLFGSRPPANDSLWDLARNEGFQVFTYDRNFSNKEKEVDVAISTQIMEDSFLHMRSERGDRVVLVSGDRDYLPTVESLAKRGLPTTVVFWKHATAVDLRNRADDYSDLTPLFDHLTRQRRAAD